MRTAREIYQTSLRLLGERNGENTRSFEERAVDLINLLLGDLYELETSLKKGGASFEEPLQEIGSLDEKIGYSDLITASLMPLGLAAYLIHEEDPVRAGDFYQMYSRAVDRLRSRCRSGRRHKICRPY